MMGPLSNDTAKGLGSFPPTDASASERFRFGKVHENVFHVSFVFYDLCGNFPHVIDKYISYTYPFLPVGVRGHYFRRLFAFQRNQ